MKYAGLKLLLLRRTMPELRNNHILPLIADIGGYANFLSSANVFVFPNGSRLQLGYCDSERDLTRFQGAEYEVICFEEATLFAEAWIVFISTTLRTTRKDFTPRIYYTCNPGGIGHSYIKRLFIDRIYRDNENPDDYVMIRSNVMDNPHLDAGYISMLEALPPVQRRAHLDGDWDVYEGQVFSEFINDPKHYQDRLYTHVIEPFDIPENWPVWRSMDWGENHPFSIGWWAVDDGGRLYRIREWYGGLPGMGNVGLHMTAPEVAQGIIEREQCEELRWRRILGVADPSIWNKNGGINIISAFTSAGVLFTKADNTRIPGWQQVHQRLRFDGEGRPGMYIFNTCRDFIRTLPMLQYAKNDPEDVEKGGEDHLGDEVRYLCMANPMRARGALLDRSRWTSEMHQRYNRADTEGKRYLIDRWQKEGALS
jgi:hypothetical protein